MLMHYIVEYQNHYESSYLFTKILPKLIEHGIEVGPLLSSKIFYVKIEYDDWPPIHNNLDKCIRPYSGSIFQIRSQYKTVFPEEIYNSLGD